MARHKLLVKLITKRPLIIGLVFVLLLANFAYLPKVFAGTLTNAQLVEEGGASNANPMIVGDGQSLALAFTTVGSTAANWSMTITFTGWTGSGGTGTVNTTQTIANTGCGGGTGLFGASYTGLPGTLSASGTTTGNSYITISSTGGSNALSASTGYCTILTSTSAITNPTTAASYSVTINDSVDSDTIEMAVLSSGANQYTISATVAPTFTMSLNNTSDSFSGNLSSTAVTTTSGVTTTINTNAAEGWFVWAEDANNGLKSTSTSTTIPSAASGSNYNFSGNTGTPKYGLGVSTDNTTNYAYGSGSTGGALSNSTYYEIATSASPAAGVTFVTHELANISATTPAGADYTDTITEIGAGSF